MKLATRKNGSRDGELVIVSRDLKLCVPAPSIARTMQQALDNWDELAPRLESAYQELNQGNVETAREFDEVLADADDYRWTRWTNDSGTVLEFVEHSWIQPGSEGEGHCIPGADVPGGCGADTEVSYTDAALAFYLAHPKRP